MTEGQLKALALQQEEHAMRVKLLKAKQKYAKRQDKFRKEEHEMKRQISWYET